MDGQQAPELEVLDHGELLQALRLIHANEALVHFRPGGDSTDVPQLVGVLCKGTGLHLSDEQDALEEHVVLVVLTHRFLIHKMSGLQVGVVYEL